MCAIENGKNHSQKVVIVAVLSALIIVVQLLSGILKIGAVNLSFVLIPIVVGAIVCGKGVGAILGLVFGVVVLFMGVLGMDQFTFILFQSSPIITALICLIKGTACGFLAGLSYELLNKKNNVVAVYVASIVTPIVNTGLFIIGALFLKDVLFANFIKEGVTLAYFLFIGCAGINFLVELAINVVFAPACIRVIKVVKRR